MNELAVASGVNRGAGIFVGISNLFKDVARGMDEGEMERSPDRLDTGEQLVGVVGGIETGVLLCEKEKGSSSSLSGS